MPGALFSVNPTTARGVPGLFARELGLCRGMLGLFAAEMHTFRNPVGVSDFLFAGFQVNLPIFTKDFMRRHWGCDLVYGHIVQRDHHLIISAGLGTTHAPVRFMRPPEVVELTIGGMRPQS